MRGVACTSRFWLERGGRLPVNAFRRVKARPILGGLSADARRRNVQVAFRVHSGLKVPVKDMRILVVDHDLTTGQWPTPLGEPPKRAGVACVDVLALARVASPRAPAL